MNKNIISNITDNFDFHRREYLTIRPWIKTHFEKNGFDCDLTYDNESLFLINSFEDIEDEITIHDIELLICNKYSTKFFQEHIRANGFYDYELNPNSKVEVVQLLEHEHATTILKPMLDALIVFEKFDHDWKQKIFKRIDLDILSMILRLFSKNECNIIENGIDFLQALCREQKYTKDTTFETVCTFIGENICVKEGSIDFLKKNPIFINKNYITLNPRCFELDSQYWDEFNTGDICRNYKAIDYLKRLSPDMINWESVCLYTRDIQFMEDNIQYLREENKKIIKEDLQELILMNEYMMPFITNHINEFDSIVLNLISFNASGIEYLEQHKELLDDGILENPNIVTYDYATIRESRFELNNQIIGYFYRPTKIQKWIEAGNEVEDYEP